MPLIRPFDPATDYEAFAEIHNVTTPYWPATVEELRYGDANRDPSFVTERFMVEVDGRCVAVGGFRMRPQSRAPHHCGFGLAVLPAYQRRGIGTALLARIVEASSCHGARVWSTGYREDNTAQAEFLAKHGFVIESKSWESELELAQVDWPARRAQAARICEAADMEILPLSRLAEREPDWQRRAYALYLEVIEEILQLYAAGGDDAEDDEEPPEPASFEDFFRGKLDGPWALPDAYFIAVAQPGGEWVGMSTLGKLVSEPAKLQTGLTGVLKPWRRRGIATALKITVLDWATKQGYKQVETMNDQTNQHMLAINETLGFRRNHAIIEVKRREPTA